MNIKDFEKRAMEQDKRNIFKKCNDNLSTMPEPIQKFFEEANPTDVEVSMDGNAIKFYPCEELGDLQKDYELEEHGYVFATCNSDPIFINSGKIYTCCHGSPNPKSELMADSFEEFLALID